MKGGQGRWVVALLVCVSAATAWSGDWSRLMTDGKLAADLGDHDQASAAFRAVASDGSAPPSLRWEALVRLGLVRNAAGDPEAGAAAFRSVAVDYADDAKAMRFLTRAVTSGLPGKIWVDFKERFEELLRTARIVSSEKFGPGMMPSKVTLSNGEIELSGIWKNLSGADSGDSYVHEVGAYEIDKVLGLDMVPPTILRSLEGEEGSLQLWVHGCETLGTVRDRAPDSPEWRHQALRMRAFDYLIQNGDRNPGNVLVDARWELVLIDHTRAFSDAQVALELPDCFDRRMLTTLRQLGLPVLQARLKGLLDEQQLKGLLRRRDSLVTHAEQLIRERGESAVVF
jgi:hypothetical protein